MVKCQLYLRHKWTDENLQMKLVNFENVLKLTSVYTFVVKIHFLIVEKVFNMVIASGSQKDKKHVPYLFTLSVGGVRLSQL